MKKLISIMLIIGLAMTMVFANGNSEKPATSDKVELKFWSLFTGGDGEFFDAMIKEFNASQDEIVMVNDMVKFDDYYTKLTTALATKNAPDVVVVHQANLLNYVPSGSLLPLDEYLDPATVADFQTAPLEACKFDGKIYSLPFDVHPIVMYYNTDILKEAGITTLPNTAEEFLEASKQIKEKTGKWAFAIDNTTGVYKAYTLTRLFMSLVAQQGGSVLNSDNTAANFNNEYGEKAAQFLSDLVNKYGYNPNELDYDAAMNTFKLGDAAFYFNGVWATGSLEQVDGLNFKAAPLPAFLGESAAWAGSHTLAVPVQKNQDPAKVKAAVTFIDWMTEHGEMWAKAGHIPTRKSVTEKEEFKALPYRADYAAAAASALATPRTAAWEEIYGTMSDMLEDLVTNNKDVKSSLAEIEATVNKIISTY